MKTIDIIQQLNNQLNKVSDFGNEIFEIIEDKYIIEHANVQKKNL